MQIENQDATMVLHNAPDDVVLEIIFISFCIIPYDTV